MAIQIRTARQMWIGRLPTFLVFVALLTAIAQVRAQTMDPRQEADQRLVSAGAAAMLQGGSQALAAHLDGLQDVLTHIPDGYRKIEQAGGTIRYRADNDADFAAFSAWTAERARAVGQPAPSVIRLPDTYTKASFMTAWYFIDTKQPQKALAAIEPGLAIAPLETRLLAEKGQALIMLRRFDAALAHYDGALGAEGFLPPKGRAMLLRAKGFSLTELRRFDEAEKAYRDSLTLEPDHAGARDEIAYIARVRGGARPTAPQLTTYDRARTGQPPKQ